MLDTAVVLFEWTLTFHREIKCIWARKVTLPTALYTINRYVVIAQFMFVIWDPQSNTVSANVNRHVKHGHDLTVCFRGIGSNAFQFFDSEIDDISTQLH